VAESSVHGTVTCEIVTDHGGTNKLGTFRVTNGYGAWVAPLGVSPTDVRVAKLVLPDGATVATATLGCPGAGAQICPQHIHNRFSPLRGKMSAEQSYERMTESGVSIVKEPARTARGMEAVIEDSQGNWIVIVAN